MTASTSKAPSEKEMNLRTEHRPGTQIDTDAAHDYESDKVESVLDPGVVPYHKPHERVRNDLTDDAFRDEEMRNQEDAAREGKSLEFFKAGMKAEAKRNLHSVRGDILSNLPPDSPAKKTAARKRSAKKNQKAAAKRTSVAKKSMTKKSSNG